MTHKIYSTSPNIMLLYYGDPKDVPILTVENYCKWYHLYLINPDATITQLDFDILQETADKMHTEPFYDHVPNPDVVKEFCEERGWWLHDIAEEVMIGRYDLEVNS